MGCVVACDGMWCPMVGHLNPKKSPQPQKVTSTLKSHIIPKKSKKSKKSKNPPPNFFFFGSFCYKNVEKMFYQPQKVTLSPQKVKKVKKVTFIHIFFLPIFMYISTYFHVYFYLFLHIYSYFLHVDHYIYYSLPRVLPASARSPM